MVVVAMMIVTVTVVVVVVVVMVMVVLVMVTVVLMVPTQSLTHPLSPPLALSHHIAIENFLPPCQNFPRCQVRSPMLILNA